MQVMIRVFTVRKGLNMFLLLSICCVVLLITGVRVYCREGKTTLSQAYAQSQTPCGITPPSVSVHTRDLEQEYLLLWLGRRV